jgi:hypothetical protein
MVGKDNRQMKAELLTPSPNNYKIRFNSLESTNGVIGKEKKMVTKIES